jgi:hypothetical protein
LEFRTTKHNALQHFGGETKFSFYGIFNQTDVKILIK